MSCRRAYEIDLADFLAEPRAAGLEAFRDHYPRCAACSAEVRAWTELEGLLRGAETDAHPEPAILLRLADGELEPGARERVRAHVDACASCRDELAALGDASPAGTTPEPARETRRWWPDLRRLVLHPAFAYGVALLLAAPTIYELVVDDALVRDASLEEGATFAEERTRESSANRIADAPRDVFADEPALERDDARSDLAAAGAAAPLRQPAEAPVAPPLQERAQTQAVPKPERAERKTRKAVPAPSAAAVADEAVALPERETLRSLGYVAAGTSLAFEPGADGGGRVRVPLLRGRGESEVRLVSPDGRRSLVERVSDGPGEIVLDIPAAWRASGTWRVERRTGALVDVFPVQVP